MVFSTWSSSSTVLHMCVDGVHDMQLQQQHHMVNKSVQPLGVHVLALQVKGT
jgi:hypothetical protein